ncbi:MAG: hypothetical protein GZ088_16065 [Acidipila sp.]|nr:hypothetical protein [Acidipila sp.]
MEELEDEAFGKQLKVEVLVGTGGTSTVQYTAVVTLMDYTDKRASMQKLKMITDMLRGALPFCELKSEERDFHKHDLTLIGKDGTPVTKEQVVKLSQEEMRGALKGTNK